MTEPYLIGLVGARGHAGAELLRIIARHKRLMLAFAVSREWAGRKVNEIAPDIVDESMFEALSPDEVAARRSDAVILAMPDGAAAPYVDAIRKTAPDKVIIDLSADYRFDDGWVYGLPELFRQRLDGARRIANPGCYATAIELVVAPMAKHLAGPVSVFGVSGYSGAGTTPSPRNDPARLKDNLMPYKLVGHNHEREATRHLGFPVRFSPHVHPAFRGIVVTAHLPLKEPMTVAALKAAYAAAYKDEPLIALQDEPPELKDGSARLGVVIGGFAIGAEGGHAVVVAAEDNLLKGAAVQAIQNLNLALGVGELEGLTV
ncbi:MAG: N-acetyl-gamma-glutamyl-phosphate reductase [Amphiplicatus sp.]